MPLYPRAANATKAATQPILRIHAGMPSILRAKRRGSVATEAVSRVGTIHGVCHHVRRTSARAERLSRARHVAGAVGLEGADVVGLLHGQADVIEAFKEAMLHLRVHGERDIDVERRDF